MCIWSKIGAKSYGYGRQDICKDSESDLGPFETGLRGIYAVGSVFCFGLFSSPEMIFSSKSHKNNSKKMFPFKV